ncbi:hypothetical protein [Candidatus Lokiarchaeum ossiferum]|uniref:hypothetical protein n=1 Tax=Candidatus Lokiarchaeum ossiferum TaxID=2951803 RepID=UPI00352FC7A2
MMTTEQAILRTQQAERAKSSRCPRKDYMKENRIDFEIWNEVDVVQAAHNKSRTVYMPTMNQYLNQDFKKIAKQVPFNLSDEQLYDYLAFYSKEQLEKPSDKPVPQYMLVLV